jgi:hypothetical protein
MQVSVERKVESKRKRQWGAEGRDTEDDEGYRSNKLGDELGKAKIRKID